MRAYILIDLGFGDAGKGLLTDYLVRHSGAGLVVRYNGGAQAGHNVVTPAGRQHTFSQFGAGTFNPEVRTILSRHVVIHPSALLVEGDILRDKGVPDVYTRLRISDKALVITPFHQAANHIRELLRGADRHGSCGVGIGEAVEDALLYPEENILAGDLSHPDILSSKLRRIQERKRAQLVEFCQHENDGSGVRSEFALFEDTNVIENWISQIERISELGLVVSELALEEWMRESGTIIFEGAQGMLLDAQVGFHPYTTWSDCTTRNAHDLISKVDSRAQICRVGIMRAYSVRHGPGPLPAETKKLMPIVTEHNQPNEWQGDVRYGWFDAVLARYALTLCGGIDALAVTHMDVLPRLQEWIYCPGYGGYPFMDLHSFQTDITEGRLANFRPNGPLTLEERREMTNALLRAQPVLENCSTDEGEVISKIESLLDRAVDVVSRGPAATDVEILNPLSLNQ